MRRAIPKRTTTPETQKLHHCSLYDQTIRAISSDDRLAESRMLFNTALAAAYEEFRRLALAHGLIEN
jgi:hypothetical protein